jgi:acyl-CoA thioesterase-2
MTHPPTHPPAEAVADPTLLDLLTLEPLERDLFRATTVFEEQWALYGGQVAAQALLAAGRTVDEDRSPHSLHGYYLRGGDASRPTLFRVYRDRDGRSFSARRVVAIQNGEVIFNMSASFHVAEEGLDRQFDPPIDAGDPREQQAFTPPRLFSMEGRLPKQPFPGVQWPTRFWARCTQDLPPDPLTQACVLTYLSDILTGLAPLHDGTWRTGSSLDHAVWFHRPVRADEWFLYETDSPAAASGRALCLGQIWAADGTHVATVAQEGLIRSLG